MILVVYKGAEIGMKVASVKGGKFIWRDIMERYLLSIIAAASILGGACKNEIVGWNDRTSGAKSDVKSEECKSDDAGKGVFHILVMVVCTMQVEKSLFTEALICL